MEFKSLFSTQLALIEKQIEDGQVETSQIMEAIESLQEDVKKRMDSLPLYDQQKYSDHLNGVRDKVRNRSRQKRFQFKSKKGHKVEPISKVSSIPITPKEKVPALESNKYLVFRDHTSSLHVNDLVNSTVIAPYVDGSVYISGLTGSTLHLNCHQCRIHDSSNIKVYLENCKTPVIENSFGVAFFVDASESTDLSIKDFSQLNAASRNLNYTITQVDHSVWKPAASLVE